MNYLRTTLLLTALTALFMGIGYLFGGASGALLALLLAAGLILGLLERRQSGSDDAWCAGSRRPDRTGPIRACSRASPTCRIADATRLPHGQSSAECVRDRS